MFTLYVTHPACLNHLTPAGHPERPNRLRAVEQELRRHLTHFNILRNDSP
jgi:acetoin utilization deacetylase AcuC-like enzyme